jgi:Transposase DDE domain group 1
MRTLAMPKTAEPWSLTSLREKLIKIGANVVAHGRYITSQMAEVAVSRQMVAEILSLIGRLRPSHASVSGAR